MGAVVLRRQVSRLLLRGVRVGVRVVGDKSRLGAKKPRKLSGSLESESIRAVARLRLGVSVSDGFPHDVVARSRGMDGQVQ